MSERVSPRNKLVEFVNNVILGPETKGVVEAIKRDSHDPDYWHTLVRTDEGELKHFTSSSRMMIVTKDGTIRRKYVDMSMYPKIGDRFNIRTRGAGIIHTPRCKIEKDPFNLQGSKPE